MKPETVLLFPTNTSDYFQSLLQTPGGVQVRTCVVTGLQGTYRPLEASVCTCCEMGLGGIFSVGLLGNMVDSC